MTMLNKGEVLKLRDNKYKVVDFIGKGKLGYSYLVENKNERLVLKKIHHEPCFYYNFGNKLMAEVWAYRKLFEIGINVPELFYFDEEEEYIVKEYIEGETASTLIANNKLDEKYIEDLFKMAIKGYAQHINIDFFPTNYVTSGNKLYYIDYELNKYSEEWNLENWGIYYWANNEGMKQLIDYNDPSKLNIDIKKGLPYKEPFEKKIQNWIKKYKKI